MPSLMISLLREDGHFNNLCFRTFTETEFITMEGSEFTK